MQWFEFVLLLVAIVTVGRIIRVAIEHRKPPPSADDPVNAELLQRLNQVEERVRVLERIVTDEKYDLRQQFKDLGT